MYYLNIPGRLRERKARKEEEKGDECQMTQREANTLCEGAPIDVSNNISKVFAFIMTCVFYSPIVPVGIPICMCGLILIYYSYKYMLLRVHKMPEMFGDLMATFFASFMPFILLTWCIAYVIFISEINNTYAEEFNEQYKDDTSGTTATTKDLDND